MDLGTIFEVKEAFRSLRGEQRINKPVDHTIKCPRSTGSENERIVGERGTSWPRGLTKRGKEDWHPWMLLKCGRCTGWIWVLG